MFNWVCPQCGKDVPTSKTECPYCADRAKEAAAYAAAPPPQGAYQQPWPAPPPPPQQAPFPPPPQAAWQPQPPPSAPAPVWQPPVAMTTTTPPPPPPPQQYAPQPQQGWAPPPPPGYAQPSAGAPWPPPAKRSGPPTWVLGIGIGILFISLGAGVIYFMQRPTVGRTNTAEKAGLENPANASQQKVTNPLQKYVEVVGIRMMTENKKPVAKFIVVNHSTGEIAGLEGNVTLWASTSRSEEDSIGSFTFKAPNLGPNASEELTAPLKTKLKPYEMPDWQNATPELQVTAPQP